MHCIYSKLRRDFYFNCLSCLFLWYLFKHLHRADLVLADLYFLHENRTDSYAVSQRHLVEWSHLQFDFLQEKTEHGSGHTGLHDRLSKKICRCKTLQKGRSKSWETVFNEKVAAFYLKKSNRNLTFGDEKQTAGWDYNKKLNTINILASEAWLVHLSI